MNQVASDDSNNSFPLFKPWDALALLRDVQREAFKPGTEVFAEATNLFFFDLVTEHDSQNFSRYLDRLREEGVQFSAEFDAFEAAWRQDEWNHYLGYRRLYTICSGRDESDVHQETIGRRADFQPMAPLLDEEFKICLVLAYDEIFTAKACQQDTKLFESFSDPTLATWNKLVARDEMFHFRNVTEILRRRHASRLSEAEAFLNRLIEWDLTGNDYKATFVLDHVSSRYTPTTLTKNRDTVLTQLMSP